MIGRVLLCVDGLIEAPVAPAPEGGASGPAAAAAPGRGGARWCPAGHPRARPRQRVAVRGVRCRACKIVPVEGRPCVQLTTLLHTTNSTPGHGMRTWTKTLYSQAAIRAIGTPDDGGAASRRQGHRSSE